MRRFRFLTFIAAASMFAAGCQETLVETGTRRQGEVSIRLDDVLPELTTPTKSVETNLPDLDDFEVEIYNASAVRLYRDSYANTKGKNILLNEGGYRLLVQHGDSAAVAFNAPWFSFDTQFTIAPQSVTQVSGEARMNKIKAVVSYDQTSIVDALSDYYSKIVLTETATGRTHELTYAKDETSAGYFPAAGTLTYQFYAMIDGQWLYYEAAPVAYQANDFVTFRVQINYGTGLLSLVTIIEDGTLQEETVEEIVPAGAANQEHPTMTLTGFDDNSEYVFVEGVPAAGRVQADIVAMYGIQSLVLDVDSDYLAALGVPSSVDLVSPSADVEAALKSVGFRWPKDMSGVRFANFDLAALPEYAGYDAAAGGLFSGDFTLTVTDMGGFTASTSFSVNSAAPTVSFTPQSWNAWARKITGLTAEVQTGNPDMVSLQYSADGQNWSDVAVTGIEGNSLSFSEIPGLEPDTEYSFRLIYNGQEGNVIASASLTTEAAAQVGNAGFEDWSSERMYHQSITGNSIYRYYFWAADTEESDRWWDTNNILTTPNPGNSYVWDYRSAPGVVPTADEGQTASYHLRTHDGQSALITEGHSGNAVEIATVGWGTGNTWSLFGHSASNKTAGRLYLGIYGDPISYGRSFSSRPDAVTFWYKFYSYNSESTTPYAVVYDSDGNQIGYGSVSISSTVNSFTQGRIDIEYTVNAKAGSIAIVFASTDSDSPETKDVQGSAGAFQGYNDSRHIGSILTIDDIELIYE